jgi:hypothetical protein
MALILRLWEATYLVLVSSQMVGSCNSHQYNSSQGDRLKIRPCKQQGGKVKLCQSQGARSGPTNGREASSNDRGQSPAQQSSSAPITQIVQQLTTPATQQVVQQLAQGRFSTSYQMPQSAHRIAPLVQRIIRNVDPNYFNSRLQGYATCYT